MTKYLTGNPVGSADPRDLYDTATVADKLVQGTEAAYPDRLGVSRKSWAGIEAEAAAFFESSGYEFVGDYAAGIELTRYSQIVRDTSGEFWRLSGSTTLPYTTTGAGLPEGGAFVAVGDAVLRQDLVQPVATYNSVAGMKGAASLGVGRKARTLGYCAPGDGGGNDYEIVAGATGTDDGGSFIDLDSGLQAKGLFSNGVQVRQFGGVGPNNIAPAIQAALAYGKFCAILEDDYVFEGEVSIPSDCLIWMQNPRITMTLDGEFGRGFHFADGTSNSHIVGTASIVAAASILGSDGFRNAVFSWGPDYYVPDSPLGAYNCNIYGQGIDVECAGPANIKVCAIASLTDGAYIHGIRATGQSNFGFVCHWGGRGSHDVLTDATWHPHNIIFDNCEGYQSAAGNWLRSFTFSAGGRCEVRNCKSDSMTLSYNLFVGDYGYTYAQNISKDEQFQYKIVNSRSRGAGAGVSMTARSSGLNGSPNWEGAANKARVDVDGLKINGDDFDTGLLVAMASLDVFEGNRIDIYDSVAGKAREWLYPQQCNLVKISANVLHSNRARIRDCEKAILDIDYRKPTPTPDATSFAVVQEGVRHMEVYGTLRDVRTGVSTISGDVPNTYLKVGADFDNIGLSCVDTNSGFLHIDGGSGTNLATTTTTANKYLYHIKSSTGFIIRGINVLSSDARYIIFVDNAAANGVIDTNFLGDLNASATSPAAIFKSDAENVYIDPNSNIIAGNVPKLVHP